MPEGHTIRRLALEHARVFAGEPLRVSSPQGRFAGAQLVDGRELRGTDAYGKHLFYVFADDRLVHVHLGLYGSFTLGPLPAPQPRGLVRMRLVGQTHWADLRGPGACEVVDPAQAAALTARLGPDPLRADGDPERAWARLHRSRQPVAGLLMEQTVLAGVGNVYRAEVLFRARLDPFTPGREVARERWEALWADLVRLMRAGVRTGRIVTTAPEHRTRRGPVRAEDA
ncbi:MAG TPA: DNA-formamidopyrimidine glycosylase family protein, partial [Actinomycetes bacterium]|nr:DNA-formamidopyrimidine glycosylase family protein [Actinomycetes bacterium]